MQTCSVFCILLVSFDWDLGDQTVGIASCRHIKVRSGSFEVAPGAFWCCLMGDKSVHIPAHTFNIFLIKLGISLTRSTSVGGAFGKTIPLAVCVESNNSPGDLIHSASDSPVGISCRPEQTGDSLTSVAIKMI
jgi:hypothetical protein